MELFPVQQQELFGWLLLLSENNSAGPFTATVSTLLRAGRKAAGVPGAAPPLKRSA